MLVSDVISAVRRRLGDIREERWKDDALILYTSLCQNDICIFTNYHRKEGKVLLADDVLVYPLPTDCIRLERIEYNDKFFPIESRNSIDSNTATFPCALKDNLAWNEIEIRLGQDEESLFTSLINAYGVLVTSDTDQPDTTECPLEDDHGVLVEGMTEDCELEDDYGVLTQGPLYSDQEAECKIYYSAVPAIVTSVDTELVLPDMWLSAFIHYVCAMALQDDNDANNIQRGELEAQKYNRILQQLFKTSAKDFTTNVKSKLLTPIRRV